MDKSVKSIPLKKGKSQTYRYKKGDIIIACYTIRDIYHVYITLTTSNIDPKNVHKCLRAPSIPSGSGVKHVTIVGKAIDDTVEGKLLVDNIIDRLIETYSTLVEDVSVRGYDGLSTVIVSNGGRVRGTQWGAQYENRKTQELPHLD
jgi:hypothetical protein